MDIELVEEFVDNNFNVIDSEFGKVVQWDWGVATTHRPFIDILFGEVIQNGFNLSKTTEQIIQDMILHSISHNMAFTELIIRYKNITLF